MIQAKRTMLVRLLTLAVAIAILPGPSAQSSTEISREASRVDDLINAGHYAEAAKVIQSMLDLLHARQREDDALVFLAYLGKAAVEQGRPEFAGRVFQSADTLQSRTMLSYYEPVLLREKAAFQYAAGEYGNAAELAAQAQRAAMDWHYYRIRAEYCRSLQALALLRMGNVAEAKRLAAIAAQAVPKKGGYHPGFAPRILYSACVVMAQAGEFAPADGFCRRGLEEALRSKTETRDLSLGHLAFAEYWLQAGDLTRSRESAVRAAELTKRLFGPQHQDMVDALVIEAMIDWREGNTEGARAKTNDATRIAAALFGAGSAAAARPAHALPPEGPTSR